MKPFLALRKRGSGGPLTWADVRSATLNADANGFIGYTVRQRFDPAGLVDFTGNWLRFTWRSSSGGVLSFAKAFVQLEGGTAFQFASTPVPITFDGGSVSQSTAANLDKVSDAIAFASAGTAALIVSMYSTGQGNYRCNAANANGACKYKAGDDAATVAATGYSTQAGMEDIMKLIEAA